MSPSLFPGQARKERETSNEVGVEPKAPKLCAFSSILCNAGGEAGRRFVVAENDSHLQAPVVRLPGISVCLYQEMTNLLLISTSCCTASVITR